VEGTDVDGGLDGRTHGGPPWLVRAGAMTSSRVGPDLTDTTTASRPRRATR
jgi:hypothetical protein